VTRISGLEFVKRLLEHETVRRRDSTMWVLPSETARDRTIQFLERAAIPFLSKNCYVAPHYQRSFKDETLLALARTLHPAHIVIAIGGGNQDKLGRYLKENLDHRPAMPPRSVARSQARLCAGDGGTREHVGCFVLDGDCEGRVWAWAAVARIGRLHGDDGVDAAEVLCGRRGHRAHHRSRRGGGRV